MPLAHVRSQNVHTRTTCTHKRTRPRGNVLIVVRSLFCVSAKRQEARGPMMNAWEFTASGSIGLTRVTTVRACDVIYSSRWRSLSFSNESNGTRPRWKVQWSGKKRVSTIDANVSRKKKKMGKQVKMLEIENLTIRLLHLHSRNEHRINITLLIFYRVIQSFTWIHADWKLGM